MAFAADALHVLFQGSLPGAGGQPPGPDEREAYEELEYAGELMVAQFLSLVRSALRPKE